MQIYWNILGIVLAFFIGGFIGNFYHLILFKKPGGRSKLMLPPSCQRCGRPERRIWMLPILWYPLVKGRCRKCGHPFSKKYVLYEVISGIVFALLFFYYGPTLFLLKTTVFFVFFFVNYALHFRYEIILARLYVPGLVVGVALSLLPGTPTPGDAIIGILLAGGFFFIPIVFGYDPLKAYPEMKRHILLLTLIGAFLGWQSVLIVLALSAFLAIIIPVLLPKEFGHDAEGVFASTILAMVLAVTFFREEIASFYFRLR